MERSPLKKEFMVALCPRSCCLRKTPRRLHSGPIGSQSPSSQNNPHAKVACSDHWPYQLWRSEWIPRLEGRIRRKARCHCLGLCYSKLMYFLCRGQTQRKLQFLPLPTSTLTLTHRTAHLVPVLAAIQGHACSVMSNSLQPHPWDSPGENTGMGCHFLLQGIFLIQGSNLSLWHLLHWQPDTLLLTHLGSSLATINAPQSLRTLHQGDFTDCSCKLCQPTSPSAEDSQRTANDNWT